MSECAKYDPLFVNYRPSGVTVFTLKKSDFVFLTEVANNEERAQFDKQLHVLIDMMKRDSPAWQTYLQRK